MMLTISINATDYYVSLLTTDGSSGSQITPDTCEVVQVYTINGQTYNSNISYLPSSGYFSVPVQGGATYGYNIRKYGYASRYSAQHYMPYDNTSYYSMSLLPKSTYSAFGYGYPLSYSSNNVSSKFGWRIMNNSLDFHQGLDIARPYGTTIYSICASNNITASYHYSMGNYVQASSLAGYRIRYMHMSQLSVQNNSSISQGTQIGYVGSTGNSTGNHLHIDIYTATYDQYIDPEAFFN